MYLIVMVSNDMSKDTLVFTLLKLYECKDIFIYYFNCRCYMYKLGNIFHVLP